MSCEFVSAQPPKVQKILSSGSSPAINEQRIRGSGGPDVAVLRYQAQGLFRHFPEFSIGSGTKLVPTGSSRTADISLVSPPPRRIDGSILLPVFPNSPGELGRSQRINPEVHDQPSHPSR
jgi:hypothetical protein